MSNEINDYRNYKTQQTIRKKTNIPDKRNLEFCITERLGDLSFFRHLSYYVPKNEIMLFLYRNISFELISYLDNSNQSFDHFCNNFEQTPCLLENYLLYLYNNYTNHLETSYSTYFNQLMQLRASNYYKYIFDMLNWTVYKNDNFDEIDNENNENFLLSLYYPGILKTDPPRFPIRFCKSLKNLSNARNGSKNYFIKNSELEMNIEFKGLPANIYICYSKFYVDVISANKKLEIIERYDTIDEFKNGCKNDFNCKEVYNTSNYGLYSLDQHETFLCNYEFLQSFYKAFNCSTIITKESSIDECPFVYLPLIQYIFANVHKNFNKCQFKLPTVESKLRIKNSDSKWQNRQQTIDKIA